MGTRDGYNLRPDSDSTRIYYSLGVIDKDIDANAPAFPKHTSTSTPKVVTGDWQILLMGVAPITIYAQPGGAIVTRLSLDQLLHSTLRSGDYYRITLPGKDGWVHRNAVIGQM